MSDMLAVIYNDELNVQVGLISMTNPILQNSFHQYVTAKFDVLFAGDLVDTDHLETVEEFLLCDNHISSTYCVRNTELINRFSKEGDSVLLECVPALTKITSRDVKHAIWLNTKANILGWDLGIDKLFSKSVKIKRQTELALRMELAMQRIIIDSRTSDTSRSEIMSQCSELLKEIESIDESLVVESMGSINDEVMQRTFEERTKLM